MTADDRLERLDAIDLGGLEDFESEDLETRGDEEDDGRNAFVTSLWDEHGFGEVGAPGARDRGAVIARALVIAHQMCQSYVDTFSTDDARYRVTFDPSFSTAGTDLVGKVVVISPSPVYDETLTPTQAGLVLTGMATHEVSHVRYDRTTIAAVRRVFGDKRSPMALCNLLGDVRIERRFADDYPGYRDVFRPMIDYIAKSGRAVPVSTSNAINLAIRAVRFAKYAEWDTPELVVERDWWQAWAERWVKEDAPRRVVEAVREGLRHVVEVQTLAKAKAKKQAKERGAPSGDALRIRDSIAGLTPLAQKAAKLMGEGKKGEEIASILGLSTNDAKILIRSTRRQMAGLRQTKLNVEGLDMVDRLLADMDQARARVAAAREGGRA